MQRLVLTACYVQRRFSNLWPVRPHTIKNLLRMCQRRSAHEIEMQLFEMSLFMNPHAHSRYAFYLENQTSTFDYVFLIACFSLTVGQGRFSALTFKTDTFHGEASPKLKRSTCDGFAIFCYIDLCCTRNVLILKHDVHSRACDYTHRRTYHLQMAEAV